jgi:two-component system phosphate regulon sensor histidine kinase PhoR
MNDVQELSTQVERHLFWMRLIDSLADVFDAHGVCAEVARLISDYVSSTVVVALDDPSLEEHDIWISKPGDAFYQTRWHRCDDLIAYLGEIEEPTVFDVTDDAHSRFSTSEIWSLASDRIAAAAIPQPSSDSSEFPYGAIFILDAIEGSEFELTHLGFIASQVSVYLDRAFLRLKTDRQEVEFGLVSDISNSITSSLDLNAIVSVVSDAARRAIGTEQISIALIDPSERYLNFFQELMGPLLQDLPEAKIEIDEGIAGWVAKHGEPVIVNDVYSDDRFYKGFDALTGFQTKSILCVPLTIEERVIGILEAINKIRGEFDASDLRLLQAITGPLAIAIQNARLHNRVVAEKRRVETIFASMSEGMLTADQNGVISAANSALLKLLDARDSDLIGRSLAGVIRTQQPGFREFIDLVTLSDKPFQQLICDIENRTGGYVPVIVSGAGIQHGGDGIDELVFVFSDLTQIREIERMRDDFFNNIVHELHTPLATILMYARLLLKGKAEGDKEKTARFLETIERESNRLQILVRQMLHLAKIQATEHHKIEDTSLPNLVFDQLLPPLEEHAKNKGIEFEVEIEPNLPPVQGDEETLYMIVKNLVDNAVKFTPAGTVVVKAHLDEDWVTIVVQDDGIGIPPEGMPNLFSRFYRAQTAVERGIAGTGLGLYMVKEGLDYCGGTIEVESAPGKGTKFLVRMVVA